MNIDFYRVNNTFAPKKCGKRGSFSIKYLRYIFRIVQSIISNTGVEGETMNQNFV